MRSSNPMLREDTFSSFGGSGAVASVMTLQGTVFKTGVLLVLTAATAIYSWNAPQNLQFPLMIGGAIAGLVLCLTCSFKPAWSPVLAPLYALAEGLFLGVLSSIYQGQYAGVPQQALLATFGTLASLLVAYSTGMIKATENFKLGVVAATGGICLMYLLAFVLSLFGMPMSFLSPNDNSLIGIGVSVVIVIVAALNLVLDFDFIETGVEQGAPKYMEWYGAFGLLVTLIWLYVELLRLFAKLSKKD